MARPSKSTPRSVIVLVAAAGALSATIGSALAKKVDGFWAHLGVLLLVAVVTGLVVGAAWALVERARRQR